VSSVKFLIVAVGRPRAQAIARAIAEYEERVAHYWPIEVREVKAGNGRLSADAMRADEAERLLGAVGAAWLVALDERGDSMPSQQFASWMSARREAAADVAFVIGGPTGLDARVLSRARTRLSIAPWTLPHELARLVLVEQLYRAGTIVRREPYHK
jgi:23S rRNA (pseudouridine1915-N3)-methyltransferase